MGLIDKIGLKIFPTCAPSIADTGDICEAFLARAFSTFLSLETLSYAGNEGRYASPGVEMTHDGTQQRPDPLHAWSLEDRVDCHPPTSRSPRDGCGTFDRVSKYL